MRQGQTDRTSWPARIGLILGSLLLLVCVLEAGMRAAGAYKIRVQEEANRFDPDSKGQYRIVCIGESTTARGGPDSWPSQLEDELCRRFGADKFRVFNKGREAIDTSALLSRIEKHLDTYRPQMVIAMMGVNDGEIFAHGESERERGFWSDLRVVKLLRILADRIADWRREQALNGEGRPDAGSQYSAVSEKSEAKEPALLAAPPLVADEDAAVPDGEKEEDVKKEEPIPAAAVADAVGADKESPGAETVSVAVPRGRDEEETDAEESISAPVPDAKEEPVVKAPEPETADAELSGGEPAGARDTEGRPKAASVLISPFDCPDSAELCESRGVEYFAAGQTDNAEIMLRAAVSRDPENPKRRIRLAWLLRETGRPDEALDFLRVVIKNHPDIDWAYTELGHLARQKGDMKEAEDNYLRAARLAPEYAGVHIDLGNFYLAAEDKETAAAMFKRAEPLIAADDTASMAELAMYLKRTGALERAEDYYLRIIAAGRADGNVWIEHGACLWEMERYEEAEAAYARAIELDPRNTVAMLARGRLLGSMNRRREAQATLERLLAIDPENPDAKLELFDLLMERKGRAADAAADGAADSGGAGPQEDLFIAATRALEENRLDAAALNLQALLRFKPDDRATAERLFSVYVRAKNWEKAMAVLDEYNLRDYLSTRRTLDVGCCLMSTGKLKEAEKLFNDIASKPLEKGMNEQELSFCYTYLGNAYRREGDPAYAEKMFRRALGFTPGNTSIMLDMGRAIKETGRMEEALELLEHITVLSPGYDDAFIELGNWYKDLDEVEKAAAVFEKALRLNPGNAQIYTSLARNYLLMHWISKARDLLEEAIRADPRYAPAWHEMGNVLVDTHYPEEALEHYARALELGAEPIEIYPNIGRAHMMAGRYAEAEQYFRSRLKARPNDMMTLTDLARCQLHQGRVEEAEKFFVQAMAERKPDYNDLLILGRCLRLMRRMTKAQEILTRACKLDSGKPEAHYELGLLYKQTGRFRKAADKFEYLLELDDEYAQVCLTDLGVCYWQLGFFARARKVFGRALELRPKDVKLYLDLGLRYREGGKFLEAESLFSKAFELDPRCAAALVGLGHCRLDQGDFEGAREVLRRAIEMDPKRGRAYRLLGRSYAQQGNFGMARTIFEQGIERVPDFWELYVALWHCIRESHPGHLEGEEVILKAVEKAPYIPDAYIEAGFFYVQNEEYAQAEEMFRQAIALDPENSVPYVQLVDVYIDMNAPEKLEALVSEMQERGGMDTDDNKNRFERIYGFLAVYYRQKGDSARADEFFAKAGNLRMQYYQPVTKKNFLRLYEILQSRGIKLVCMQYPMRDTEPLSRVFAPGSDVVFVSNEDNFRAALGRYEFMELFEDHFAGDFGHATRLGNSLIAKRLADELETRIFGAPQGQDK